MSDAPFSIDPVLHACAALGDQDRLYVAPAGFVAADGGAGALQLGNSAVGFTSWQLRAVTTEQSADVWLLPVTATDAALQALPQALASSMQQQMAAVVAPRPALAFGSHHLTLDAPRIMGILNTTPDSFSDGGRHAAVDTAIAAGLAMAAAGAHMIDVGGESTRPGAAYIDADEEIARVVPVIRALADAGILVSIDTRKAAVMAAALDAGAAVINDIAALAHDPQALGVAAAAQCPVILMHAPSQSADPHAGGDNAADPLLTVYDWLDQRIAAVVAGGVRRENIIADPGFGFGKGLAGDVALHAGLAQFHALGVPMLVGASRKRMIGALDRDAPADARLGGSVALHLMAAQKGAQLLRVHDVAETRQALAMWQAMLPHGVA